MPATGPAHRTSIRRPTVAMKWLAPVGAALAVAGCAGGQAQPSVGEPAAAPSAATPPPAATALGQQNHRPMSAHAVVQALTRSGLLAPNPLDTTAEDCPHSGCTQSIITDTLRVTSFPAPADAARYAKERGLRSSGNIVVTFAPPLTPADRSRYWSAIVRLDP